MWSYVPGAGSSSSPLSLELTPEVWKELYNDVYDERDQPMNTNNIPKEYVKLRVHFTLGTGSIEVLNHSRGSNIAKASFIGFNISFDKREESMSLCGNLKSMELVDYHTPNTKFPRLIAPKQLDVNETDDVDGDDYPYFFTMFFDKKPLNSIADYSLQLTTKPLDIVVSRPFINRLVEFFSKPITLIRRRRMEDLELIAYNRFQEIRQQTEEQLKQAMSKRKIFDLKIHLSAPNIMIPKSFEDENSTMLVLVLGTLSITSDLNELTLLHDREKAISGLDNLIQNGQGGDSDDSDVEYFSDVETESAFEQELVADEIMKKNLSDKDFSYLYDKFYLNLTSLEAIISSCSMDYYKHRKIKDENEIIIEKFDVNLYLEVCNIESYEDLPKIKVVGNLPSLGVNISPEQTTKIMQIFHSMNKKSPQPQSIPSPQIALDQSIDGESKSRFDLEEEKIVKDLLDHQKQEIKNLYTNIQPPTNNQPSKPKTQIFVSLSIPEVVLAIKEDNRDLIILWLKGISASYVKHSYHVDVTLIVHGAIVEDQLQPWGPDFRYLATSEQQKHAKIDDLIHVAYRSISSTSPTYQNINHSLDFKFNDLDVMLNRETIVVLIGCLKNIVKSLKNDSANQIPVPNPDPNSVNNNIIDNNNNNNNIISDNNNINIEVVNKVDEQPVAQNPQSVATPVISEEEKMKILFVARVQVNAVSFTLNDTGVKIGKMNLRNSSMTVEIRKTTLLIGGKMGSMNVEDYDPSSRLYPQSFDVNGEEEMVSFVYQTYDKESKNFPGYGVLLKIKLNSIRYLWLERFQLRFRKFWSEIAPMQGFISRTASSAAAVIKQQRLFKFELQLNNPYIVIPKNCNSSKGIIADLGLISISKEFPINEDGVMMSRFEVGIKQMNLKSGILGSTSYKTILMNTDLQLYWEKPFDEAKQLEHIYPGLNVFVNFPSLHIMLAEEQALLLCSTIVENICTVPTEHEQMVEAIKSKLRNDLLDAANGDTKVDVNPTYLILLSGNNNTIVPLPPVVDENFEFQPDELKWCDMKILFYLQGGKLEMLQSSGEDKDGNPLYVGELEVRNFSMDYQMFSNGSHHGIFGIEILKVYDRRENNPNQFKELLTPLIPGTGRLKSFTAVDLVTPSIVGNLANSTNQFSARYERRPDTSQVISIAIHNSYFIVVPDAIFEIYGLMRPIVFEDIIQTSLLWKTWKNPNPGIVIPSHKLRSEMDVKIVISKSELFFLEDPANINTQSIVIRTTFNIFYKRNNLTNNRSWTIMIERMEAYKCRLATEDSAISIMNQINWSVDWLMTNTSNAINIKLEPIILYFSYKDYLVCKGIINNWKPWLVGRKERIREKFQDEIQTETALLTDIESKERISDSLRKNSKYNVHFANNPENFLDDDDEKNENEEDSFDSLTSGSHSDNSDDENDLEIEKNEYLEQLDPAIKELLDLREQEELYVIRNTPTRPDEDQIERKNEEEEDVIIIDEKDENKMEIVVKDDKVKVTVVDSKAAASGSENQPLPNPPQNQVMDQLLVLKTAGFSFILINDSLGETNTPLANIKTNNISLEWSNWSSAMKFHMSSDLQIDYYNGQLEVWEPVIEPWSFQFKISRIQSPPVTKYILSASRILLLNVTLAMIETTLNTIESIKLSQKQEREGITPESDDLRPNLHPYVLRNESGLRAWYWLSNTHTNNNQKDFPIDESVKELDVNQEAPLLIIENENPQNKRMIRDETQKVPTISVKLDGEYTPVKNLPIDKIGTYISKISPVDRLATLVLDVSYRKGCKVLTLKSNISIKNCTTSPLEIQSVINKNTTNFNPILADQVFSLPVTCTSSGFIQCRPSSQYRWSENKINLLELRKRLELRSIIHCKHTKSSLLGSFSFSPQSSSQSPHESNEIFYYMSVHLRDGKYYTISMYPIVIIENLLPVEMEIKIINRSNRFVIFSGKISKGRSSTHSKC